MKNPVSKSSKADPVQMRLTLLRERIKQAPSGPGIYRWLNETGTVLYVGKAKSLKKRLAQYVTPPKGNIGPWREAFLRQIADFDVTVTNTELEALVLETHLIKQMKPKYNVLMKDDKNYVYIRISVQDPFPRIDIVRRLEQDGARYFGPRQTAEEARQILSMLRKIYPFRNCRMEIGPARSEEREAGSGIDNDHQRSPLNASRFPLEVICKHKDRKTPCLDFHIQQCSAPCTGTKTPEDYYRESIAGVIEFLKGNEETVKKLLKEKMLKAAAEKKFEIAAQIRNDLQRFDQKETDVELVSDTTGDDLDIVGAALLAGRSHVVVLHRRGGKMIGEHSYHLSGQPESAVELVTQFLAQFYDEDMEIPPVIVIGEELEELDVLTQLLATRRGKSVKILLPERGKKSHLLLLAEKNAKEKALQAEAKWEADRRNTEAALEELQQLLSLPSPPDRIEGYDISHLGGTETVGSMVVMKNGKSANDQYRSFTIRTLKRGAIDDYTSLREVLTRRLRHLVENLKREEVEWGKEGVTFGRPRKAEHALLMELVQSHCPPCEEPMDAESFLVARHEETIIAFGQLHTYKEGLQELRCVWVDPSYERTQLPRFLVRHLLKNLKKGKIYTIIPAHLEAAYGSLGFRYVITPPKQLEASLVARQSSSEEDQPIALLYEAAQNKVDPSLSTTPDLLVIDGGKGQLSTVVQVLKAMKLDIPVIGLAKREEEVFVPKQSDPILFPKESPAKFLLMRLRDEAHRFANRHREGRGLKAAKASALDDVRGLGEATREELLKKFRTVAGIRGASDDELRGLLTDDQIWELRNVIGRE